MCKRLRSFVGTRKRVILTRPYPSHAYLNGFVVALGYEWVLLQNFHDFHPEGYVALRVRDVTDIRSDEHERLWERMLAGEGLIDRIPIPDDVRLSDASDLLESLQERGRYVIVESEDPDEDLRDFHIGLILSVDADSVCLAHFDGLGVWDDAPHVIPFDEITKVQIEAPYAQIFSKYLLEPCPHLDRRT
jgi:hypothetical protein